MQQMIAIFLVIFLAELGDKTQLATLLFATEGKTHPWLIFIAATAGLVVSTGLAVLLGVGAGKLLSELPLKLMAGIGFIAIGLWSVSSHFTTAS